MSVIKSADVGSVVRVRALAAEAPRLDPATIAQAAWEGERTTLLGDLAMLTERVQVRDGEIARLEAEVAAARREGEALGHAEGLKAGAEVGVQALARLGEGIDQASRQLAEALSALDRLAVAVARNGLAKVLGDPELHAQLLGAALRHQLANLQAQAVLVVEVSRRDFADPDALAALARAADRPGLELQASSDLDPGECRINLRLGALEVGVGQQWGRLRAELDDLTQPEAAA
jgi:flagellar biosynthesis/type III secretory pathway protein FliH